MQLQISPISDWIDLNEGPIVIAGPCSAESKSQLNDTIHELSLWQSKVQLIRAGVWKPRTRPNSFEGVGTKGLQWLVEAGKKYGFRCCTEVASRFHVEAALDAGVDVLWIGARTTVNPFMVQDIAEALEGKAIPVMVKNPINPDIQLWAGAFERLNQMGVTKLAAIHRGFSTYEQQLYRNRPNWEIPIELSRMLPDLPVICDPSHICGTRDSLHIVAQQALDLNFDGLMFETHINPDEAMSDAKQQLTPHALHTLLSSLIERNDFSEEGAHEVMQNLRSKIDRIDSYIIELLAERMGIAEEIGEYKDEHKVKIYQPERWAHVLDRALKIGLKSSLTKDFIDQLYRQIHNESIRRQAKVMGQPDWSVEELIEQKS